MASDAHAHPENLLHLFPEAEKQRRKLGVACAASSSNKTEIIYHEQIARSAKKDNAPPLFLCFAVHPQLPSSLSFDHSKHISAFQLFLKQFFLDKLDLLSLLASEVRIDAVGECGFDLYSQSFRETEAVQDELFIHHLEIARRHDLPIVLHVRRAMHKIFPHTKILKTLPAVVFHSWPGVPDEAFSLLRKGICAFFSFGTALLLNHKNAIRSCAELPVEHLLFETDAPYQPLKGKVFSSWEDLPAIIGEAAKIRKETGAKKGTETEELEENTDKNFFRVFKR